MSIKITVPYSRSRSADAWLEDNSYNSYQYYVHHHTKLDDQENILLISCEYEFYQDSCKLSEFALLFS